ncbi:hypothetical protein DFH08DRAFT_800022 [Mycena albidolilacea]|uniref:Uncharacterized protein n=1 Tax=Mycena albidolilacea TaxID=1033008 RepID=A0AAD7AMU8_9AGAR|nr:hypothetical protein DFH08DRAFT_800022 [Mycena albidolilacea]
MDGGSNEEKKDVWMYVQARGCGGIMADRWMIFEDERRQGTDVRWGKATKDERRRRRRAGSALDLREAESATQTHPGPEHTHRTSPHASTHVHALAGNGRTKTQIATVPALVPLVDVTPFSTSTSAPNAFHPPPLFPDEVDGERSRLEDESRRSSWPSAGAVAEAVDADLARLPFTGAAEGVDAARVERPVVGVGVGVAVDADVSVAGVAVGTGMVDDAASSDPDADARWLLFPWVLPLLLALELSLLAFASRGYPRDAIAGEYRRVRHRMTAMQKDRAAGGTELEGQHKEGNRAE